MVLTGLALMTVGQLTFAVVGTFELGVLARILVGAGDAMIFVSVIRVVALWFPVRQSPLITQLTGQLGQVGAIAASFPLAAALHGVGWTPTFVGASLLGVLLAVVVLLVMRDAPGEEHPRIRVRALGQSLRTTWHSPGTRLGLWPHFTSQFGMTVFTLLWGFPFLVRGQGLSEAAAGALLVLMTVTQIGLGPILGGIVARHP
jgi:MFS family permease